MLRSLALEAMRKQHHQARGPKPLGFAGSDELVHDGLRTVGEIAELRFPQHKRTGIGLRIAIFEPEHAELAQGAVEHFEPGLAGLVARGAERDIFLTGLLIGPDGMTLAEGTAAAILTRQANA